MHYNYECMPKEYDESTFKSWIEEQFDKQEMVEFNTMLENLKMLDDWCKNNEKTEFFRYFQDAVIGAHCRALHYKKKVWSAKNETKKAECESKKNWWEKLFEGATSGAPILLPVVTAIMDHVDIVEIDMIQFLVAVAVGAGISVPLGIFKRSRQEKEEAAERSRRATEAEEAKHKYDETWIRHTLCDARLRLALSKFAAQEHPTIEDYNELVKSTFAILEQNLDQFAVNMCPKGMAFREPREAGVK